MIQLNDYQLTADINTKSTYLYFDIFILILIFILYIFYIFDYYIIIYIYIFYNIYNLLILYLKVARNALLGASIVEGVRLAAVNFIVNYT